jgi:hypothetical protein
VLASLTIVTVNSALGCPFYTVKQEQREHNNVRRWGAGPQTKTVILNVRLYTSVRFTDPRTICFNPGYILHGDPCANAAVVVNGTGKFLIPGFTNSHLHLTDAESLGSFTPYSLTTAIHVNCGSATQCNIMRHQPALAQFFSAGKSAVGKNSSNEATDPTRPGDTLIYLDTNVTQFIAAQLVGGADFHKITAEVNEPSTQQ